MAVSAESNDAVRTCAACVVGRTYRLISEPVDHTIVEPSNDSAGAANAPPDTTVSSTTADGRAAPLDTAQRSTTASETFVAAVLTPGTENATTHPLPLIPGAALRRSAVGVEVPATRSRIQTLPLVPAGSVADSNTATPPVSDTCTLELKAATGCVPPAVTDTGSTATGTPCAPVRELNAPTTPTAPTAQAPNRAARWRRGAN